MNARLPVRQELRPKPVNPSGEVAILWERVPDGRREHGWRWSPSWQVPIEAAEEYSTDGQA